MESDAAATVLSDIIPGIAEIVSRETESRNLMIRPPPFLRLIGLFARRIGCKKSF